MTQVGPRPTPCIYRAGDGIVGRYAALHLYKIDNPLLFGRRLTILNLSNNSLNLPLSCLIGIENLVLEQDLQRCQLTIGHSTMQQIPPVVLLLLAAKFAQVLCPGKIDHFHKHLGIPIRHDLKDVARCRRRSRRPRRRYRRYRLSPGCRASSSTDARRRISNT